MNDSSAVEPFARSMLDVADDTLVAAFMDDSLFRWVFPDPVTRPRRLRRLNRVPLEYGLRYGYVRQSDEGRCVAIWIPPGEPMSPGRMVRSGMLTVPFRTGLGPMARFGGANGVMDKIHKRHMSGPHWELLILGVDPALQGRGRGSALVRDGLARADESGLRCYLNTNTPANVPLLRAARVQRARRGNPRQGRADGVGDAPEGHSSDPRLTDAAAVRQRLRPAQAPEVLGVGRSN